MNPIQIAAKFYEARDTGDAYFTAEKIEFLVKNHNWEMVPSGAGKFKLRQKDNHHMTTVDFEAAEIMEPS